MVIVFGLSASGFYLLSVSPSQPSRPFPKLLIHKNFLYRIKLVCRSWQDALRTKGDYPVYQDVFLANRGGLRGPQTYAIESPGDLYGSLVRCSEGRPRGGCFAH